MFCPFLCFVCHYVRVGCCCFFLRAFLHASCIAYAYFFPFFDGVFFLVCFYGCVIEGVFEQGCFGTCVL